MNTDPVDISAAIQLRSRLQQRLRDQETAEERWTRFVQLQRAAFELLRSSPAGYQNFLRRNMSSRRVEVVNGEWRPVSAARRAGET